MSPRKKRSQRAERQTVESLEFARVGLLECMLWCPGFLWVHRVAEMLICEASTEPVHGKAYRVLGTCVSFALRIRLENGCTAINHTKVGFIFWYGTCYLNSLSSGRSIYARLAQMDGTRQSTLSL